MRVFEVHHEVQKPAQRALTLYRWDSIILKIFFPFLHLGSLRFRFSLKSLVSYSNLFRTSRSTFLSIDPFIETLNTFKIIKWCSTSNRSWNAHIKSLFSPFSIISTVSPQASVNRSSYPLSNSLLTALGKNFLLASEILSKIREKHFWRTMISD